MGFVCFLRKIEKKAMFLFILFVPSKAIFRCFGLIPGSPCSLVLLIEKQESEKRGNFQFN